MTDDHLNYPNITAQLWYNLEYPTSNQAGSEKYLGWGGKSSHSKPVIYQIFHSVNPKQGCSERECQRGNVLTLKKVLEWFVIRKWSSIVGLNAGCPHPSGAGTAHSKRTKPLLTAGIICSLLKKRHPCDLCKYLCLRYARKKNTINCRREAIFFFHTKNWHFFGDEHWFLL